MLTLSAVICFITFPILLCAANSSKHHPLSDEFIELINSKQSLWTAGRNFHRLTPLRYIYRLAGTIKSHRLSNHTKTKHYYESIDISDIDLPKNFDSREHWPHCPILNDIRDQGGCGSCWAVAAVSAMTDRICIRSQGEKNVYLSSDDVLSCCKDCGYGCEGGSLEKAWSYFKRVGIVTGGHYNSKQGCKPYPFPPCNHYEPSIGNKCSSRTKTPDCKKQCIADYKINYSIDLHRGKNFYKLKSNTQIQANIYKHGPVTTFFDVHEDFLSYKHGIYEHTSGGLIGGHSVKLIGWGEENGLKYWLAANSWNTNWGDNGFFKIIRNINHCHIEENVVAGYVRN